MDLMTMWKQARGEVALPAGEVQAFDRRSGVALVRYTSQDMRAIATPDPETLKRFAEMVAKECAARPVPDEWLVKVRRLVEGFEHVSGIARLWEPDHSSGSERALWARATEACADAAKLLNARDAAAIRRHVKGE